MTPEQARNIAGNSPETCTIHFLSHFRELCNKGHERFPGSCAVPFSETWFHQPTNDYNPGLAFAAMGLSLSTYMNEPSNDFTYIRTSLESFNLEDVDLSTFIHRNGEDDLELENNLNLVSCGFGHRMIKDANENDRELIVVVVRGTSPTREWDSNADVADSVIDGNYHLPYHEGFKRTADEALHQFASYTEKHALDTSQALIWIVGHSRGASIVNIMAALMNESEGGVQFSKDRVFAYTFSSSLTTTREDAHNAAFDNIFNVINPEDYIPRIPLARWGFKRFGRDLFLPSISTSYVAYRSYIKQVEQQFLDWTHIPYQAFHGFGRTNLFERHAADISKNVAVMYERERFSHGGTLTFARYFREFCDIASKTGAEIIGDAKVLGRYAGGPFEHFLAYFVRNQVIAHEAPGAHQEEGYLAKMKACYELGIDITKNDCCDTTRHTVFGDVDMEVFNKNGALVARIHNHKVDTSLYSSDEFLGMFANREYDTTSVWVPREKGYTVKIRPAKEGMYDLTEAEQTPLGHVIEQRFYADVALSKHEWTLWSEATAHEPTHRAKPGETLDIDVKVEGAKRGSECDAMGIKGATFGDHVTIHAYHARHVRFLGWFEEGVPADAAPLSSDHSYTFRIEQSATLIARFEQKAAEKHNASDQEQGSAEGKRTHAA